MKIIIFIISLILICSGQGFSQVTNAVLVNECFYLYDINDFHQRVDMSIQNNVTFRGEIVLNCGIDFSNITSINCYLYIEFQNTNISWDYDIFPNNFSLLNDNSNRSFYLRFYFPEPVHLISPYKDYFFYIKGATETVFKNDTVVINNNSLSTIGRIIVDRFFSHKFEIKDFPVKIKPSYEDDIKFQITNYGNYKETYYFDVRNKDYLNSKGLFFNIPSKVELESGESTNVSFLVKASSKASKGEYLVTFESISENGIIFEGDNIENCSISISIEKENSNIHIKTETITLFVILVIILILLSYIRYYKKSRYRIK